MMKKVFPNWKGILVNICSSSIKRQQIVSIERISVSTWQHRLRSYEALLSEAQNIERRTLFWTSHYFFPFTSLSLSEKGKVWVINVFAPACLCTRLPSTASTSSFSPELAKKYFLNSSNNIPCWGGCQRWESSDAVQEETGEGIHVGGSDIVRGGVHVGPSGAWAISVSNFSTSPDGWWTDWTDNERGVDSGQWITAPDHPAAHPGCLWSELKLGSLACTEVNIIFMNTLFFGACGTMN